MDYLHDRSDAEWDSPTHSGRIRTLIVCHGITAEFRNKPQSRGVRVPRRDEKGRSDIEELVRISEEEEAKALRAELSQFLRSGECRAEIAALIQVPIETIVSDALKSPDFVALVRQQLVANLERTIKDAATAAAKGALKDLNITIAADAREKIRAQADDTVRKAFAESLQNFATDRLPELGENVRKNVQSETEEAVRTGVENAVANLEAGWTYPIANALDAAVRRQLDATVGGAQAQIVLTTPTPLPPEPQEGYGRPIGTAASTAKKPNLWKRLRGLPEASESPKAPAPPTFPVPFAEIPRGIWIGLAVLAISLVFFPLIYRAAVNFSGDENKPSVTATTASSSTATTPATSTVDHRQNPIWEEYNKALLAEKARLPHAALPSLDAGRCVQKAILDATKYGPIAAASLKTSLASCPGLSAGAPTSKKDVPSTIVAALQSQLAAARPPCRSAITVEGVDGLGGNRTTAALNAYMTCKKLILPDDLTTLADYVAASIAIIDERLQSEKLGPV